MLTRNVLAVDDDERYLRMIKIFFENSGVDLHTVTSAELALIKLAAHQFDLIITDFNMGGMDGVEFASLAREKTGVPIIMLSGTASRDLAHAAESVGIQRVLDKSLSPYDIVRIVMKEIGINCKTAANEAMGRVEC